MVLSPVIQVVSMIIIVTAFSTLYKKELSYVDTALKNSTSANQTSSASTKSAIRYVLGYSLPFFINFGYVTSVAVYLMLPVTDRESQLRKLLHLNGTRGVAYWAGMFACDMLLFMIPTVVFLVLVKAMKIASFENDIAGLFMILFGFGVSLIALTYLIQFIFS
jgi:hypothetical protein